MMGVDNGLKLLVYGKRNMGKTSLVKNVIAKSWLKRQSSGFFMYVDLMGVKQLSHISERMTIAFSEAYNSCFKMKSVFNNMLKIITGIKPSIELDEKGYPKLSFGIVGGEKIRPFTDILKQLDLIYASNIPILLALDEFQDIALIDQAEALFRNGLEHIDSRIPVVKLGSKQHLINRIFARPKAPFFNWGTHVYFEAIDYHEYWQYMDERFKQEDFGSHSRMQYTCRTRCRECRKRLTGFASPYYSMTLRKARSQKRILIQGFPKLSLIGETNRRSIYPVLRYRSRR